jgi:hypothetical protein
VLFTLNARTPELFTGGEGVLHAQALYIALLPVERGWSVDAWRAGRASGSDSAGPTAVSNLTYPLVLLQLAIIYSFNTLSKSGPSWHDGTAVAKALAAASLVSGWGARIAQLPDWMLHAFTRGTLLIEGGLPFLLLSPWKRRYTHGLAALLMITLHGGIYLCLEVGSFSAAMLSYTPLLWHPRGFEEKVFIPKRSVRRVQAVLVAAIVYVIGGRLSRDLLLYPNRPQLPFPAMLERATRALGLLQGWMMFSPGPPGRDFVVVTDAVTSKGLHFDPWRQAARGPSKPLTELPRSVVKAHMFTRYENALSGQSDAPMHPFFSRWVLAQRGPDGAPVERFDAWLMVVLTDAKYIVPAEKLEERVGVLPLSFVDALPIKSFAAKGVWAPERAIDRKISPNGTSVLTPVSASFSAGCPTLTLDLGEPRTVRSAYMQAGSKDEFTIEGSTDGVAFRPVAKMLPTQGFQLDGRIVQLPGDSMRFVRVRHAQSEGMRGFLSEIALFERVVPMPVVPERPSMEFLSAYTRPSVASIVSGSNHPAPDCPVEDPAKLVAERAKP